MSSVTISVPPVVNVPAGNLAESIVPVAIAEAGKGLLFILILILNFLKICFQLCLYESKLFF